MDLRQSTKLLLVAAIAAAGLVGPAGSAQLSGRECAGLAKEKSKLVAKGVRSQLDKGPQWAKANLTPEQLAKIKRLVGLIEALKFQCDDGEMQKARQRMASGYYRKWEALKPPPPTRNPKFAAAQAGAGADAPTPAKTAQPAPQPKGAGQGGN